MLRVLIGVLIIKKVYLIKINLDGIQTAKCVNIENLLVEIYARGSHRVGFGAVQLSRDLDETTQKVQKNQSCGVLAAVVRNKMFN